MADNSPGPRPINCPTIFTFLQEHIVFAVPIFAAVLLLTWAIALLLFRLCIPELRIHTNATYFWFLSGLCLFPYTCIPRPDDEEAWRVKRAKRQATLEMRMERKRAFQQEKEQTEELRRDFARQQALKTQRDWQILHSKESKEDKQTPLSGQPRYPRRLRDMDPSPRTPTPHSRPNLRTLAERKTPSPLARSQLAPAPNRSPRLPWGGRLAVSRRRSEEQRDDEVAEEYSEEGEISPMRRRGPVRRMSDMFQKAAAEERAEAAARAARAIREEDERAEKAERARLRKLAAKSKHLRRKASEQRAIDEEQRMRDEENRIREEAQHEIEALQLEKEAELEEREVMIEAKLNKLKVARMKEKQRQQATLEALELAQQERLAAEEAEQEAMARQQEVEARAAALEKRRQREERQRMEEEEQQRLEQEAYAKEMRRHHRRQRSFDQPPPRPVYQLDSGYSGGPTPQQAQMMQMRQQQAQAQQLYLQQQQQQQQMLALQQQVRPAWSAQQPAQAMRPTYPQPTMVPQMGYNQFSQRPYGY